MIDIHCHILPGTDDGPETIEKALDVARSLEKQGFTHIIATPHSLDGIYNVEPEMVHTGVQKLNRILIENSIGIKVYPGAEYPLQLELLNNINNLVTLNGTQYILVELPFNQPIPNYADDVFFQLQAKGFIPILAHPERCSGLQANPELLATYVRNGVLAQVNMASLAGRYGSTVGNIALGWIKANCIHFLATDSHRPFKYDVGNFQRQIGQTTWDKLMVNSSMVFSGQNLDVDLPTKLQSKTILSRVSDLVFRRKVVND